MNQVLDCPSNDALQHVLAEGFGEFEEQQIVEHLEQCVDCQQRLDELASGPVLAAELATQLSSHLETCSNLRQAVSDDTNTTGVKWSRALIGQDVGGYRISRLIGQGGMGVVYEATDLRLKRPVALKMLPPFAQQHAHARTRFLREARSMSRISHRNVATVFGAEDSRDSPFIAMEFVDGVTLAELLARRGTLSSNELVRIGFQISSGLAAAHELGVLHRDIKPNNILLQKGTGQIKIVDFGLARTHQDHRLTQTDHVAGTPAYLAPEVIVGNAADERSDLYSLGCVLYELATGRPPFVADSAFTIMRLATSSEVRPIQDWNAEIDLNVAEVIHRLLHRDPASRFQSADELKHALRSLHGESATPNTQRPKKSVPPPIPVQSCVDTATSAAVTNTSIFEFQSQLLPSPRRGSRNTKRWQGLPIGLAAVLLAAFGGWLIAKLGEVRDSESARSIVQRRTPAEDTEVASVTPTVAPFHEDYIRVESDDEVEWYDSLGEAIEAADDGSTVLIYRSGEILIEETIECSQSDLEIEAGDGHTPILVAAGREVSPLILAEHSLDVTGIQFVRPRDEDWDDEPGKIKGTTLNVEDGERKAVPGFLLSEEGELSINNCVFVANAQKLVD